MRGAEARSRPVSSANQSHEIAPLGLFEHEIADNNPRLLERPQEHSDASANRCSATASSSSGDETNDAAAPSFCLSSQKPLSVGDSLSYALAVEIECCIG